MAQARLHRLRRVLRRLWYRWLIARRLRPVHVRRSRRDPLRDLDRVRDGLLAQSY